MHLLEEKVSPYAVYVQTDTPEAALPGWWDEQWLLCEKVAQTEGRAVLLLDEPQTLGGSWSSLLKTKIERVARAKLPVRFVLASSTSVLKSQELNSAKAIEKIEVPHWSAEDLIRSLGQPRRGSVERLVRMGSYPGAVMFRDDPVRWKAYLRDSVVEPALGRDIVLSGKVVRSPVLLRQLFAVCTNLPARVIPVQKLCAEYVNAGTMQTVAQYLEYLEESYLVACLPKYTGRSRKIRTPPKIVVLNQGLLSAASSAPSPTAETDPDRWAEWVENAVLAHAWNQGQTVHYWLEEPYEVDGVFEGSWGKWAVKVATRHYYGRRSLGDPRILPDGSRTFIRCCSVRKGIRPGPHGLGSRLWHGRTSC